MRILLLWFCFAMPLFSNAQLLSGPVLDEGRKLLSHSDFTIVGAYEGYIVYEIAVTREGKVSSERKLGDQSTIHSTPAHVLGKNLVQKLEFQKGTFYPEFHHVLVRVNYKKQAN